MQSSNLHDKNKNNDENDVTAKRYNSTYKNCFKSPLTARIISGSIGSILTSLVVTPLEVVKVGTQSIISTLPTSPSTQAITNNKLLVTPCPKRCGTFIIFNGHMDCVLSKNSVPYFDHKSCKLLKNYTSTTAATTTGNSIRINNSSNNNIGTISMIRKIFALEGLPGIYAGLRPTLIMAVPNTVLYFTSYEEIVWKLRNNNNNYTDIRYIDNNNLERIYPMIAGALARLIASTVTAPFEFLKTRQATTPTITFQSIIQNEGYNTLYSGLRPTLYHDVPFSAIYWFYLEELRNIWNNNNNNKTVITPLEQAGQSFINGAISGMIAAACTTPFDVIKTRQQQQSSISSPSYTIVETSTTTKPAIIKRRRHHNC